MGSLPIQPDVNDAVVDPTNPQRVYAAGTDGVVRSDDSGRTWDAASAGIEDGEIVALAINPAQPETLIAATADDTLYHSSDDATAWQRIGP